MMKKLSLLIAILSMACFLFAQDTTFVQTLTWQDDARSGYYTFPDDPNVSYRKIIMRYNMRCHDDAVGNGNVGCREWDYSCNTFITDPDMIDSTRATHPDYLIPGYSEATFPYTDQSVYSYQQYEQATLNYGIPVSSNITEVDGAIPATLTLDGETSRQLYLYDLNTLTNLGMESGDITHLSFYVESVGATTGFLRIRMQDFYEDELLPNSILPLTEETEVYFSNTDFNTEGWMTLPIRPYEWNGASGILIEISYTTNTEVVAPSLKTFEADAAAIGSQGANSYLEFNGYGAFIPPAGLFEAVSNEITISLWAYGNENVLPVNTSIFEGADNNNQRQVNVHLPWSNGRVYWDCGNDGGGYDRIDKAAEMSELAGKWNHWAFTKNANTGEMKIYLNGELWHSGTGKTKPIDVTDFIVGANINGGNAYFGKVDELRIWSKELDQMEIQSWMNYNIQDSHPDYDALLAYYPLNEGSGAITADASGNGYEAAIYNAPAWQQYRGGELFTGFEASDAIPAIQFIQGTYTEAPVEESSIVLDSTLVPLYTVIQFEVNESNDLVAIDTQYHWLASETYLYDPMGTVIDTYPIAEEGAITPEDLTYYQKRDAKFEILSLVTPYGNGLDLGAEGKTFFFDVTDYAPILKGEKFLSLELGGQNQEEMDIQFWFIEGTPPQEVISVQNIWPFRRGWYADVQSDRYFEPRSLTLNPNADAFKLRSAITGHGQNGEFVARNHYLNIDGGDQEFVYEVWKACGSIPIYPQGGTWLFDRAGWCPGHPTDVHQFWLHDYDPGQELEIDYGVNGGTLSEANYLVSNQLVTYGAPGFERDAGIEAIIRPSTRVEFERFNPMCSQPIVVIQNTGNAIINEVEIAYGLEGGETMVYTWEGDLAFLDTVHVELPSPDVSFWTGAGDNATFFALIGEVNGSEDDYADNNYMSSTFEMPTFFEFEELLQFHFRTNNRASENSYTFRDSDGNIVLTRDDMENATLYKDDIELPPGCYTLHVEDTGGDGLYYWYWDAVNIDVGAGSAIFKRVINENIQLSVKSFEAEFGNSIFFDFVLPATTSNEDLTEARRFSAYPNPATDHFIVELQGFEAQDLDVQIYSLAGQLMTNESIQHNGTSLLKHEVNISTLPSGVYLLKVQGQDKVWTREIVKM